MAQPHPDLPVELLLDITETLLTLGDKESCRSAAHMAQTCTAVRSSEAGKQALYKHALASRALSVPVVLPANLEYETEVLQASKWPHQAPPAAPLEDTSTTDAEAVSESFLSTDGHVSLSLDRKSLLCFDRLPAPSSAQPHVHATCDEESVLRKTIKLAGYATAWAVDESGGAHCAILYDGEEVREAGEENAVEIIEFWNLRTGLREGRLALQPSDGLDSYGPIDFIDINAQYILIVRATYGEVRLSEVRCMSVDAGAAVIWSYTPEAYWFTLGVYLISPCFVIAMVMIEGEDGTAYHLRTHRLDRTASRHVATFRLPREDTRGSVNHITCGADLVPGEQGVMAIMIHSELYLLNIATIVDILYSEANKSSAEVRILDEGWMEKNSYKRPSEEAYRQVCLAASGWRCVYTFERDQKRADEKQVLRFIDATPEHRQASQGDDSADLAGSWKPVLYEHPYSQYLPQSACAEDAELISQFIGARLLLHATPPPTELHPDPTASLRIWRL